MNASIRRISVIVEETHAEIGVKLDKPVRKAAAVAVIANPFAGRYVEDLTVLVDLGAELGDLLGHKCLTALGVSPTVVESYGKAALVGEDGELEHAAALLHPSLGKPLRDTIGGGAALIPSSKKRGGPGRPFDIPLGHKDAAFVRSHFDGMEVSVSDAPKPDEIVVAIAMAVGGRPLPRIGGLTVSGIEGKDGLR
ncbi:amino acid synthesis family protein [Rhizobium tubonense]|uniref:Peptide synthetase n=1 Tax=Rhizobium tubonense TaxID=484088 RepID=A0A2W4CW44_9HYPH|nr:amino acid synthesis family protein [Rhizobium tubonense]PZM14505.1 peptide synthetase [Rhizobium tubonense]